MKDTHAHLMCLLRDCVLLYFAFLLLVVHSAEVDGVTKLAVVACFYEKGDRSPTFIKQLMRQALPKASADAQALTPELDFRVCPSPPLPSRPPPRLCTLEV